MEIQHGNTTIHNEAESHYVYDSVKAWLTNYTSAQTRKTYGRILQSFQTFNDGILIEAKKQDVIDYRDYLIHTMNRANATINLHLYAIRSFFENLVSEGILEKNPAQKVGAMKVKAYGKTKSLNVSQNEHDRILQSIDTDNEMGARDYAIILLLLTTGLRVSAIANVTITSIEQSGQQVYLNYVNKGGEQRRKLLVPKALEAIQSYFKFRLVSDNSPLFATVRGKSKNPVQVFGKAMSRVAISKMITKRAKQAGVSAISAHGLRHTASKYLRSIGYTVSQIQAFLDHEDRRTTLIYLDQLDSEEDENQIANDMNNMFR